MGEVESQSVREWSSGRCRILTGRTTMRSRLNLVWLAVLLLLHCVGDGKPFMYGLRCMRTYVHVHVASSGLAYAQSVGIAD